MSSEQTEKILLDKSYSTVFQTFPRIFDVKSCGRPKLDRFSESIQEPLQDRSMVNKPHDITQQDIKFLIRTAQEPTRLFSIEAIGFQA